jgi:hypothetical protein
MPPRTTTTVATIEEKQFFDETIRALSSSFETATDQRIFPEEK